MRPLALQNMVQEWLGMCLFESSSGAKCISTPEDRKGDMAWEAKFESDSEIVTRGTFRRTSLGLSASEQQS